MLRSQRRAGLSALVGLGALWVAALVSPLLAYREDVRNAEDELVEHLRDRAGLQAQALGAHLGLLRAELQRLAENPQLTPEDGISAAEASLLQSALGRSPLFTGGVALLSRTGRRVWSEPTEMSLGATPLATRPWFERAVGQGLSSVDLLDSEGEGLVVVVVPVVHAGVVEGLLVGELAAATQALPGARGVNEALVVLLDEKGRVLLPSPPPAEARAPDLAARLRALVQRPGALTLGRTRLLGAAAPVDGGGLLLAVLEDEARDVQRLQRRYLGQLGFHTALLFSVLLLFTVLLRRSYRALLEAEERLRRQETMAALGTAASLIAHEVKNALNGIQGALSMMRPAEGRGELPLKALRAQVNRLGHLARSLLSFGAPRAAHRRDCELRLLVEEALGTVQVLPETADVTLTSELAEGLFLSGDPALLVAAFDNLVRNAVEAGAVARDTGLQPSPRVTVRLTRERAPEGAAGEEGVLVVEDNAGGVPPEFEPRLWDPFATARAKGIGLGLPMTRTAVQAHGGTVTYTRLPVGSRFTVRLPLQPSP
jgi:signal transduction histidine kinase